MFEDETNLGNVTVAEDATWTLEVPSPSAGPHTSRVEGPGRTELSRVSTTVATAKASARAATCDQPYTLSIMDNQTRP